MLSTSCDEPWGFDLGQVGDPDARQKDGPTMLAMVLLGGSISSGRSNGHGKYSMTAIVANLAQTTEFASKSGDPWAVSTLVKCMAVTTKYHVDMSGIFILVHGEGRNGIRDIITEGESSPEDLHGLQIIN